MQKQIDTLYLAMLQYFAGDAKRCQHFIKVHSLAALIGRTEGLDEHTQTLLEAAALVHDCGIKPGEAKYGRNDGKIQEQEGPQAAEKLLLDAGFAKEDRERICYLVGHHHTYNNINGLDYQILVEADFLVNFYEDQLPQENIKVCAERIFKTATGIKIAQAMFGI